jgi:hypothetical protein
MSDAIIETGRDLVRIKEQLGHGRFTAWLDAEFSMSERSAQNYMRAAAVFGSEPEIVAVLPPATVYQLAAPSTPPDVRDDIVRSVQAGERPSPAEVAHRVRQERQKARDAARLSKLTPKERLKDQRRAKQRDRSQKRRTEAQDRERKAHEERLTERREAAAQAARLVAQRLDYDLPAFNRLLQQALWEFPAAVEKLAASGALVSPEDTGSNVVLRTAA